MRYGSGRYLTSVAEKPAALPALLLALTITTGLIDAVSVLGLGRVFTANMTGNIVFLGLFSPAYPGTQRAGPWLH